MDWEPVAFFGGLVALLVAMALAGSYGIARPTCLAQTARMGLQSSWSFWGGCQIRLNDGRWIPLENYRVVGADQ